MKHLLTGVAMAAALAIAAPVWAQNAPAAPGGNNPTSGASGPFAPKPAAPAAAAPMQPMPMSTPARSHQVRPSVKRHMHHVVHHMRSGDSMTEQLNAQELQRITSGAPPMAPMPMAPGGNNPTSGAAGPFAPAGSAPPPPAR